MTNKVQKYVDEFDDPMVEELRERIRDKLSRITIYFIKEDHSHPMYMNTWNEVVAMQAVDDFLRRVMKILTIDPEAKSY